MRPQLHIFFLSLPPAILGGLLSSIVANYLPQIFEERRWLAIGLSLLIIVGMLIYFYKRGYWSPWDDSGEPGLI